LGRIRRQWNDPESSEASRRKESLVVSHAAGAENCLLDLTVQSHRDPRRKGLVKR
jgi:hypothetical protein